MNFNSVCSIFGSVSEHIVPTVRIRLGLSPTTIEGHTATDRTSASDERPVIWLQTCQASLRAIHQISVAEMTT